MSKYDGGIMKRPNLQIVGVGEGVESRVNYHRTDLQQNHRRKISQIKERHAVQIKEAPRTPADKTRKGTPGL